MKKVLIAIIIILSFSIIFYIFNKKDYITCTNKTMNNEYILLSKYKIYYNKNEVYKIEISEEIEAETTSKLKEIMEDIEKNYIKYKNEIGSYEYTLNQNKNKGTSNVIIDYNKMNMEAYIKYNPEAKLNGNNKYNLEDLKELYEERGAVCK